MKTGGFILMGLGSMLLLIALMMDTSVQTDSLSLPGGYGVPSTYVPSQSVSNLGKMQTQELTVLGALFSLLAGIILFAAGTLEEALGRLRFGELRPNGSYSGESTGERETQARSPEIAVCDFCDAKVAAPGSPCSSADEETLRSYNSDRLTPRCREELSSRQLI